MDLIIAIVDIAINGGPGRPVAVFMTATPIILMASCLFIHITERRS